MATKKNQPEKDFPKAEFRRAYAKDLVSRLQHAGVTSQQAKDAITLFVPFMQKEIRAGHTVDFGFMRLSLRKRKPKTIHYNLGKKGDNPTPIFMGQSYEWRITIFDSWKRKNRPQWSRVR